MSWVPPNLAQTCMNQTTVTTCLQPAILFLQLIASLFGQPKTLYGNQESLGDLRYFQQEIIIPTPRREYDFIVVGAGSAGCVVANRLTEVPKWSVLLLEAGIEEPEVADVPAFAPLMQRSNIDWMFRTQPSPKSCLGRRNRQCSWPRGKVMGGSSTINYMIYLRGHPKDYDEWASYGNKGWGYHDVLPYFIKSEDNHDPEKIEQYFHGSDGYLTVQEFRVKDENPRYLVDAYEELGLKRIDQNSDEQIGTMLLQHTTRGNERLSTNKAFILPIRKKRRNLEVQTQAQVIRVLIDPTTKTAFGVEYMRQGRILQVFARKEVIVSAGSIMSPKILMTSGVGPAVHLNSVGIPVIKDLAVGYNLQDHTTFDGVLLSLSNYSATAVSNEQQQVDAYFFKQKRQGPLGQTGPLQANAFVQTKFETEFDRQDIQFSIDATNVQNMLADPILAAETNVNPLSYYNGFMLRPILLTPKSRGVIVLNSTDPVFADPLIYANTFYEDIDLLRLIEGIKQGLNILRTEAAQKMGLGLVTNNWPHCVQFEFGTDAYWACIITHYTGTLFHPVGTCKMGPEQDKYAVVSPHLEVHGIRNLRVIDASIMPTIVRANTNAPTIMIGEKGSDLIKSKWLENYEHFSNEGNSRDTSNYYYLKR